MGCDYYIIKVLHIYYNDGYCSEIELERFGGYYNFIYDEDDSDYEKKCNEYIKDILTPSSNPISIYHNNCFNKLSSEVKYKDIVENVANKIGRNMSDILEIQKVEIRYKRD